MATNAEMQKIDEFTEEIIQPLEELYERLNNQVIGVISKRIGEIGSMTASDIDRLVNLARIKDLAEIEKLIADAEKMSQEEINRIVTESAEYNDELYDVLYTAQGKKNLRLAGDEVLYAIASYSAKNMTENVLNLSKTTAVIIDGSAKTINKAYIDAVNFAAFQVKTGTMDYYTAVRQTVSNLAKSGLRTIDFESGYSRRLDSQARMNVLDGVRQMNQEYRIQQGKEFGADGVEISAHGLCAEDHLPFQGRRYSNEEYERLNARLERPIGEMNCRHFPIPIILNISRPTYSEEELQKFNDYSNKLVTYELHNGKKKTVTRYEASQIQRALETDLRREKEQKLQFEYMGNETEKKRLNQIIKVKQAYYKKVSDDVGLKYHPERARIYK